jgi:hypothetical protein
MGMTSPSSLQRGCGQAPWGLKTLADTTRWISGWAAHLFILCPQRPFGEVYELEIDTLETTCHARDPTPLANCPVRQVSQHVSALLMAAVIVSHGSTKSRPILSQLLSWLTRVQFLKLSLDADFYNRSTLLL